MLRLLPRSALTGGSVSATSPAREPASSASPGPGSGKEDAGARDAPQKRGGAAAAAAGPASKAGGNSKAATVESAIEYIKSLQAESEAMSERAARHEREVEVLRRRVHAMERLCGEKGVDVDEAEGEEDGGPDDARETKE